MGTGCLVDARPRDQPVELAGGFDDEGNRACLPLRLGASLPAPGTSRVGCRLMTSSRVVAGMVGNRSRMVEVSRVMSVVFMTTAA
jgi:hypothetical protein